MRIGVITWFRYENYGTALQAIALQKYLKGCGYDVELINYRVPAIEKNTLPKRSTLYDITGRLLKKADKLIFKSQYKEKSKKFTKIIEDNCKISKYACSEEEYIELCNKYDYLVFGSDQIWNPNWYHPFYYANFKTIKAKRVSYAPSFGVSSVNNNVKDIKEAIDRFYRLSVREKDGLEIIDKITNRKSELVVDPTLLINKELWRSYKSSKSYNGKYILCYMLSDNKNHWKAIRKFAKRRKTQLIILPHGGHSLIQSRRIVRNAGPEDFLALIDKAEYVITDSYHALIFSSIFNKKILLFERHNPSSPKAENTRIYNFLDLLGNRDKLLSYNTKSINDEDAFNGEVSSKEIMGIIESSKQYLKESLQYEK